MKTATPLEFLLTNSVKGIAAKGNPGIENGFSKRSTLSPYTINISKRKNVNMSSLGKFQDIFGLQVKDKDA